MSTSPAEIKIPAISHVAIAVKDAEKVAQNYWNILGIGPWDIVTFRPPHLYDRRYRGKPVYYVVKIAYAQVGPVQMELLETLEGHTLYDDFLAEHGEGVQHLGYTIVGAGGVEKQIGIMAQKGFPTILSMHFGDNGSCAYFDTVSALGVSLETVKYADEMPAAPTIKYPANEAEVSPAKIKVKAIYQISLSVKNLDETMENYWNIFGIGPWDVIECVPPALHDLTYYGKPAKHTHRDGLTMVGPVELELVQPISGDTVYRDHICKHGDGINHIAFKVDNVDEAKKIFEEEGFPCVQSGKVSSDGAYAYFDTRGPLKVLWEAFRPSTSMPVSAHYPK